MIWLIFAHFIGDFPLQGEFIAANKGRYWYVMFAHCMIWSGCICAVLDVMGILVWWKIGFLVAGHFVCDKWKSSKPRTPEAWKYIYPDQGFHFLQLFIVFVF